MLLTRLSHTSRTSYFLPPPPFLLPSTIFRSLAPPAPALLRPGVLTYPSAHFHSSPWRKQDPHSPSPQPSAPQSFLPPSSPDFAESVLVKFFPSYRDSDPEQKLSVISQVRKEVENLRDGETTAMSSVNKEQNQSSCKTVLDALQAEEEKVGKKNRWYHQAFRRIAWGPTILINIVLAMFW